MKTSNKTPNESALKQPPATDLPMGNFGEIDLDAFRVNQEHFSEPQTQRILTAVPVKKPQKTAFVRVHPGVDFRMNVGIIENETGDAYLVAGSLYEGLQGEPAFSPRLLVTAVTRGGTVILWPVSLADNSWARSAHEAVEIATTQWIRLKSDREAGAYMPLVASNQTAEPVWPQMSFVQLVEIAFRGRIIKENNHPMLRQLRGE